MKKFVCVWIVGLLLATSCAEDSDPDIGINSKVKAFAGQISSVACQSMKNCCEGAGHTFVQNDCEKIIMGAMELRYSKNVHLKNIYAANCMLELRNELGSCAGTWPPAIPSCRGALRGFLKLGDSCNFTFECTGQRTCENGFCVDKPQLPITVMPYGQSCDVSCAGTCSNNKCFPDEVTRVCQGAPISPNDFVPDDDGCTVGLPCPISGEECVYARDEERYLCASAGGPEQPCRVDGTCNAPLSCVSNLCLNAGGLEQPCLEDDTCNDGLVCSFQDWCTTTSGNYAFDGCCVSAGGEDEQCLLGGTCDVGYSCVGVEDGYSCPHGNSPCCILAGAAEQPCRPDGSCDAGLSCLETQDGGKECAQAGGSDQPCYFDNSCDEGFVCDASPFTFCWPFDRCCVPAGGDGEACLSDDTCDEGFICSSNDYCPMGQSQCCVPAGDVDQPCLPGNQCNGNLECIECDEGECCADAGDELEPCLSQSVCHGDLACTVSPDCPSFGIAYTECCQSVGGDGQPCRLDGTCDSPAECFQVTDVWGENIFYQCIMTGEEDQPCIGGATCDDGLVCSDTNTSCGATACCTRAGVLGYPCLPDDACAEPTLACLDGICISSSMIQNGGAL